MASKPGLYEDALSYWSNTESTVQGMLGGFAHISDIDIAGSAQFLSYFMNDEFGTKNSRALDCGAGIGRVTKHLLLPRFDTVDLVDVTPKFVEEARNYIGEDSNRVGEFIIQGLQDFVPKEGYYDVIWCQWVTGHLSDEDFIRFLQRCKRGLSEGGVIVIKENAPPLSSTQFDHRDSSYTRTKNDLTRVIEESGLTILKEEEQQGFPKRINAVWSFGFR